MGGCSAFENENELRRSRVTDVKLIKRNFFTINNEKMSGSFYAASCFGAMRKIKSFLLPVLASTQIPPPSKKYLRSGYENIHTFRVRCTRLLAVRMKRVHEIGGNIFGFWIELPSREQPKNSERCFQRIPQERPQIFGVLLLASSPPKRRLGG